AEDVWWDSSSNLFNRSQAGIYWTAQVYSGGADWSYNPAAWTGTAGVFGAGADGVSFKVYAGVMDNAGNASYVSKQFRYDITYPTSTVSVPVNGSDVKAITAFSGVANDPGPGPSGVKLVQAAVQKTTSGGTKWWEWGVGGFNLDDPPPAGAWTQVASASVQGLDSVAWSTPVPAGLLASSNTYRVVAKAADWASNPQQNPAAGGAGAAFRYDNQAPVVNSTFPLTNQAYNAAGLQALAGTADDGTTGASGVKTVEVLLKDTIFNSYWRGDGNFDSGGYSNWVTVAGKEVWSRAWPTLQDNHPYMLWMRATDNALNMSAYPSNGQLDTNKNWDGSAALTFTYDNLTPVSLTTQPANGAILQNVSILSSIAGTAWSNTDVSRPLTAAAVDQVLINLRRNCGTAGADEWWNGTGWGGGAEQLPPLFTPNWSEPAWNITFTNAWDDGCRYTVRTRAHDIASNTEAPLSSASFLVDLSTPTASVIYPQDNGYAGVGQIVVQGRAVDGFCTTVSCVGQDAGIAPSSVTVTVERVVDHKFWDGDGFDADAPAWSTATFVGVSSGVWSYVLPAWALTDLLTYKVTSRARDRANNQQQINLTTNTFTADFSAPVSKVTIPLHGQTYQTMPQVQGTALDVGVAGVSRVFLAYYRTSGIKGWWSKSAKDFILPDALTPPEAPGAASDYWVEASTDNAVPVNWYATGVSTPDWKTAETYQVLSAAVDQGLNAEARPNSAAANTNRSQFDFAVPMPTSWIIKPNNLTPHFKSANAGLNGTANLPYSTVVQVRLWDITDGGNILAWRASDGTWVSNLTYPDWNNASGVGAWTYSIYQASWTSLHHYQLESRAGTPYESGQGPNDFYIDDGAPLAGVSMPDATYKNSLPVLAGTATDDSQGLTGAAKTVYLRLRRMEAGSPQFWNLGVATFTASAVDCISAADQTCLPPNVGGQPPNSYAVTHASFTDQSAYEADREYTVQVVGKDAAGNGATVSRNFTWDVTPPSSGLERPASAARLRSLSLVSGTAQDGWSVYHTSISIRSFNDDKCYDPANKFFTADCPYWIAASSTPNNPPFGALWTYNDADLNTALAVNNTWYTVLSKAIDTARNEQNGFTADVSSRTFIFDNAAPNVSVSFPAHLGAGAIGKYQRDLIGGAAHPFAGTAVDPRAPWNSGIRRVEIDISYFDGTDTWYWITDNWSSGTWANNNKWFVTTNVSWQSIAAPAWPVGADRQYRIEVRVEDAAYLPWTTRCPRSCCSSRLPGICRLWPVSRARPTGTCRG
ncbi:MAG: hypothetical protein WC881_09935, partial [Elusimicrobiota bacterium]